MGSGYDGLSFPAGEEFLKGISSVPIVAPPPFLGDPGAGFSSLGRAAIVAANKAAEERKAPSTHAVPLKSDVLELLDLTGSSFAVPTTLQFNEERASSS